MPARVDLRNSASGRQDSAPASAQSGAEYPSSRPASTIRIGTNRWPRASITEPKPGSSDFGTPASL